MPPNTVNVTRPGKYGNQRKVGDTFFDDKTGDPIEGTPEVVVKIFRQDMVWLAKNYPMLVRNLLEPLKGKDLACWCKPGEPCHGDVLLEIANNDDWVNNPK